MEKLLFIAFLSLATAFPNSNRVHQFQLPQYALFSSNSVPLRCPSNQHWSSCKSHCTKSCTNYQQIIPCPPVCISGCVCDDGYVWGPDEECIAVSQCELSKLDENSSESDDFCPPNEEFSRCLAHCQRNCSNWSDHLLSCQKICVPGCICKKGMVRGPHGTCIRPRKCPTRAFLAEIDELIDCPLDEHLEQCTAHCQKNCSNWNKEITCEGICVKGCVCDRGYVRNSTGKCILSEKCHHVPEPLQERERETELVCPENEHKSKYQALPDSKNLCVLDETQISICPLNYFNGCVCNQGLFRDLDNKCVELRMLHRVNEIDFMHVDREASPEYEDVDCNQGTEDKELLEMFSSIDYPEKFDQSASDRLNAVFLDLLKSKTHRDSKVREISDLDALLNDDFLN